jgi:predicted HD superfamily hydrolase involved in NAD metabolism
MESTELEELLPRLEWACRYSLSVRRYDHVERVVDHSGALARRFGVDELRVRVAAAGHDMARELAPQRLERLADRYGVPRNDPLRKHPLLLHGPVASGMLAESYGVDDQGILTAVYHHTLGSPEMDEVGKILYVADYTEPGRPYLDEADRKRLISDDLDRTVAAVILHAADRFGPMSEPTRSFYNSVSLGAHR